MVQNKIILVLEIIEIFTLMFITIVCQEQRKIQKRQLLLFQTVAKLIDDLNKIEKEIEK